MSICFKSSLSYILNCVIFELISGQSNQSGLKISELNLTANQWIEESHNYSFKQFLDFLENNEITFETIANSTVNICDQIDCDNNIAICEQNNCWPIRGVRKPHYIVTCIIVVVVIVLMLTTMYACHKETKRSNRWNNTNNRLEDHIMAIRLVQTLHYNRYNRNIQPMNEMIPLRTPPEAPPPYEFRRYSPPPDYRTAVQQSNRL